MKAHIFVEVAVTGLASKNSSVVLRHGFLLSALGSFPTLPRQGEEVSFNGSELAGQLTALEPLEVEKVIWWASPEKASVFAPSIYLKDATLKHGDEETLDEAIGAFGKLVSDSNKNTGGFGFRIERDYR
ncbi:MAG: hypothetical protein WC767_02345 [Candidatus Paceibacterota bacterium]|jgi:hypothetical protein